MGQKWTFFAIVVAGLSVTLNSLADAFAKPIVVTQNQPEFTIKLPANQTTGYQWYLSSLKTQLIQPLSYHYETVNSQQMGAPGFTSMTFKLLPAAFTIPRRLQFTVMYQRAWENSSIQQKIITVLTAPAINQHPTSN